MQGAAVDQLEENRSEDRKVSLAQEREEYKGHDPVNVGCSFPSKEEQVDWYECAPKDHHELLGFRRLELTRWETRSGSGVDSGPHSYEREASYYTQLMSN